MVLDEFAIKYIKDNYNLKRTSTIAKELKLDSRYVQRIASKFNLIDKRNKIVNCENKVKMLCVTLNDEHIWFYIDKEDLDLVYNFGKWFVKKSKNKIYIVCNKKINGKKTIVRLHRLILDKLNCPDVEIDHIDGNPLNNVRSNLRLSNRFKNMGNLQCARLDNKSTKKLNITYDNRYHNFRPEIIINKKRIYFKHFSKLKDAEILINYVRAKYVLSSQEFFNKEEIFKNTPDNIKEYADKKVLSKIGGL